MDLRELKEEDEDVNVNTKNKFTPFSLSRLSLDTVSNA